MTYTYSLKDLLDIVSVYVEKSGNVPFDLEYHRGTGLDSQTFTLSDNVAGEPLLFIKNADGETEKWSQLKLESALASSVGFTYNPTTRAVLMGDGTTGVKPASGQPVFSIGILVSGTTTGGATEATQLLNWALLTSLAAEDFSTETTLALVKAAVDAVDATLGSPAQAGEAATATSLLALESTQSGMATNVADIEALLTTLNGYVDQLEGYVDGIETLLGTIDTDTSSIVSDTAAIVVDIAAIEALLITLNGYVDQLESYLDGVETLLGTIDADTSAIASDTAAMVIDLAAMEVLLGTIDTDTGAIATDIAAIEVLLTTTNGLIDQIEGYIDGIETVLGTLVTNLGSPAQAGEAASATSALALEAGGNLAAAASSVGSLDTKEGTTGAAEDADGTRAAQLHYMNNRLAELAAGAPKAFIDISGNSALGLYSKTNTDAPSVGSRTMLVTMKVRDSETVTGTLSDAGGGDVRMTLTAAHNLKVGDYVDISGCADAAYNGHMLITAVNTVANDFDYTAAYTAVDTGSIITPSRWADTEMVFYSDAGRTTETEIARINLPTATQLKAFPVVKPSDYWTIRLTVWKQNHTVPAPHQTELAGTEAVTLAISYSPYEITRIQQGSVYLNDYRIGSATHPVITASTTVYPLTTSAGATTPYKGLDMVPALNTTFILKSEDTTVCSVTPEVKADMNATYPTIHTTVINYGALATVSDGTNTRVHSAPVPSRMMLPSVVTRLTQATAKDIISLGVSGRW